LTIKEIKWDDIKTLYDVSKLLVDFTCNVLELPNNKTIYCFGRRFLNTYYDVLIVDFNNKENSRVITYYSKLKINSKQVIYKYESTPEEYTL
jgi:hypothetical protein